jgi:3-(3-hydroxy-phenyl)propionate hydroxylase
VTAGGLTAQAIMLAADGPLAARYIGAAPAAVLLIRPDQVIAARWTGFDRAAVEQALARTGGLA